MTFETRINNGYEQIVIIAEEGKIFKRKGYNETFGRELALGYSYYIDGVKQDPPHLDVAEDFEEIDDGSDITAEEALQIIMGL